MAGSVKRQERQRRQSVIGQVVQVREIQQIHGQRRSLGKGQCHPGRHRRVQHDGVRRGVFHGLRADRRGKRGQRWGQSDRREFHECDALRLAPRPARRPPRRLPDHRRSASRPESSCPRRLRGWRSGPAGRAAASSAGPGTVRAARDRRTPPSCQVTTAAAVSRINCRRSTARLRTESRSALMTGIEGRAEPRTRPRHHSSA